MKMKIVHNEFGEYNVCFESHLGEMVSYHSSFKTLKDAEEYMRKEEYKIRTDETGQMSEG
jgi:hypothetical protein